jgi:uncharacterized protein YbaR (Trm112 family)
MKHRLLDILCCPNCGASFELNVFKSERRDVSIPVKSTARCRSKCALSKVVSSQIDPQDCVECYRTEVNEGRLKCEGCGNTYPIIGGVPRILPPSLLDETLRGYHIEFLERYGNEFADLANRQVGADGRKLKTLHAFSYQWTTFVENFNYFTGIFLSFVKPFLGPEDFRDRVVLEIGCGSGRPASVASSLGAEVIATDLSEAVQTAQSLTNYYPMLHVVQFRLLCRRNPTSTRSRSSAMQHIQGSPARTAPNHMGVWSQRVLVSPHRLVAGDHSKDAL